MVRNIDEMQKLGKDNMDATLKSFGAVSKSVQAIAVEVRERDAGGRRDERADLQMLADETAELERYAVAARELQVRDAGHELPGRPGISGVASREYARETHEARPARGDDLGGRAVDLELHSTVRRRQPGR